MTLSVVFLKGGIILKNKHWTVGWSFASVCSYITLGEKQPMLLGPSIIFSHVFFSSLCVSVSGSPPSLLPSPLPCYSIYGPLLQALHLPHKKAGWPPVTTHLPSCSVLCDECCLVVVDVKQSNLHFPCLLCRYILMLLLQDTLFGGRSSSLAPPGPWSTIQAICHCVGVCVSLLSSCLLLHTTLLTGWMLPHDPSASLPCISS